jgi:predicted metal-dependent phosphoesterase TrpH
MTDKLKAEGIQIDPEEVIRASKGVVTRLHLARKILESGYVKSTIEAFKKYIGDNAPCYVSKFRLSPKEAIELILRTKGIPVLAHPRNPGRDEWIPKFIGYGLKGMEVFYPEYSLLEINYYKGLAKKYGLLITGGSDCHGKLKDGPLIGRIRLPYRYVEELKKERNSIFG